MRQVGTSASWTTRAARPATFGRRRDRARWSARAAGSHPLKVGSGAAGHPGRPRSSAWDTSEDTAMQMERASRRLGCDERRFTLIRLMVVVMIIGVLIGIAPRSSSEHGSGLRTGQPPASEDRTRRGPDVLHETSVGTTSTPRGRRPPRGTCRGSTVETLRSARSLSRSMRIGISSWWSSPGSGTFFCGSGAGQSSHPSREWPGLHQSTRSSSAPVGGSRVPSQASPRMADASSPRCIDAHESEEQAVRLTPPTAQIHDERGFNACSRRDRDHGHLRPP